MNIQQHFRRAKLWDRLARYGITGGGILIIMSVIAILVMIAKVALPLVWSPRAEPVATVAVPGAVGRIVATGGEEFLQSEGEHADAASNRERYVFALDERGNLIILTLPGGAEAQRLQIAAPGVAGSTIAQAEVFGRLSLSLLWSDGAHSIEQVGLASSFTPEGVRVVKPTVTRLGFFPAPPAGTTVKLAIARGDDTAQTRVALLSDGRLHVARQSSSTNFLGEATVEATEFDLKDPLPAEVSTLALSGDGNRLYAGTRGGHLLRWQLESEAGELQEATKPIHGGTPITALGMVFGDVSLAVGDEKGRLTTWFPVAATTRGGLMPLREIHTLRQHGAPVVAIRASQRDKSLLSIDANGRVHIDHMTSNRHLVSVEPAEPLITATLGVRLDSIIGADAKGQLSAWALDIPHPEVSWSTLFGKVWYEGYREPAYAWQSSAATDDFEPKLSLVPMIYGTLKATFYALIFAMPLSIFGALYTSQFMRPELKRIVKPTIEVMAAIPSVVIGFLAALWLAPKVEDSVIAVFLALLLLPMALLLVMVGWQFLERMPRFQRFSTGHEFLLLVPVAILAFTAAFTLGPWLEDQLLGGSFPQWLYDVTDQQSRYDQRNSIIIAFALGFAVIPIIFTIADDSMTNIPRSLTAASLALGASRWQTAWRVVLPSASPGIFAAVMIGFGRAVGETMIVLMATGNTPIIDWSAFNGMRTLSANIAVEIPEAPVNGTLYRVLFLTAVLLFLLTFLLNTIAEVVRQRLRRKYGQL